MKSAISEATATARRATAELSNTFLHEYRWALGVLLLLALVLGLLFGIFLEALGVFVCVRTDARGGARAEPEDDSVGHPVLTIRAMSDGKGYAARYLAQSDYYAEDERVVGHWKGRGAELLGLRGPVQTEDFEAVRQGIDPATGDFLRQRHSADRVNAEGTTLAHGRHLYDFTISAPKSVSIMAILGGDQRLLAAHEKAVAEAVEELESCAAARVRQDWANGDRTTGNLVLAIYRHDTSRELDPQIHTHAVAANLTYDGAEGQIVVHTASGAERTITSKHAKSFDVVEPQAIEIAAGDRLLLMANRRDPGFRATNGEIVTVAQVDAAGLIRLEDGRRLPANYRQFAHGYAVTAHRSQGKSVDSVIISGDGMQKELFYVAASRGRQSVIVITSDKGRLRETVAHSTARKSASELARRARPGLLAGEQRGLAAARALVRRAAQFVASLPKRVWQESRMEKTHECGLSR